MVRRTARCWPSTMTRTVLPGRRRIWRTWAMVPAEKRSFFSGSSTRMSFWATRKTGLLVDMASSTAFTEASRPTSKWTIILG